MTTTHPTRKGVSQCGIIYNELNKRKGEPVTTLRLSLKSKSLAVHSRISDLRRAGHHIVNTVRRVNGKALSTYTLL